ncbi:MAG: BrnA antitoxin family protein [Betaproteobacteria bacterium]|nr:BrnA antitoxin family protein [Betaproteobacteria bacterium]
MKQTSTTEMSAISDDAPKLTQADFDRASFRVGGKPVSRKEWQDAVRSRLGKARINIMLDVPIIEHFKSLAGKRGYQTLINDTLRKVIEAGKIEADLRKIIREELHSV